MPTEFISTLASATRITPPYPREYFPHWEQNVFNGKMDDRFIRMYLSGSGNELLSKACAKHSSSMLAYNFFHWVSPDAPLTLGGKTFVDVAFEVRLPCMVPSAPANLDVALVEKGGDFVLSLESKFTEYFETKEFKISEKYKNPKNYSWAGTAERAQKWADLAAGLEDSYGARKDRYYAGIKQDICHLIAIDRLRVNDFGRGRLDTVFSRPLDKECEFAFATVVFEPADRFEAEHEAFVDFRKLFAEFSGGKCFARTGFFWPVGGFLSYGDIWNAAENMPKDLRSWLETRYMRYGAPASST